jgi:SpoVK/Ycf46/Vps4 family AAA+-type ATPase
VDAGEDEPHLCRINGLPAELLRKGRFDEIFYVDLPNDEERKRIFEIHIKKRKQDVSKIDIGVLVAQTRKRGFTGADIEGVVSEGVESAYVQKKESLTTEDVLNCINGTYSLSETQPEKIEKMKAAYEKKKFKPASRIGE